MSKAMNEILKTAKTVLNALAFDNVGNLSELQTKLNAMDGRPSPASVEKQTTPHIVTGPRLTLVKTI
jgi:hypothetical protein